MLRKNVAGQKVCFSLFKSGARIANPTIAADDFTVDIDNAGQNNVATPPTSDAAGLVTWLPSQAETNGDYITFLGNDVAGAEWEPLTIAFDTRLESILAAAVWSYGTRTLTSLSTLVTSIAAAVWGYATRTITGGGGSAADVWTYTSRTLTQTAASAADAITGENITRHRGDYWSISLTGLGSLVGRTKLYFTVKKSRTDTDAESIIQIEETAGLLYLNGAAAGTPANGSLTVTDETTGAVTIVLKAAETDDLEPSELVYDVQVSDASGNPTTLSDGGTFTVTADVTRRIT